MSLGSPRMSLSQIFSLDPGRIFWEALLLQTFLRDFYPPEAPRKFFGFTLGPGRIWEVPEFLWGFSWGFSSFQNHSMNLIPGSAAPFFA